MILASAAALGVFLVGAVLVSLLARRSHLLRQFSFPLLLVALGVALKVFTLFEVPQPARLLETIRWIWVFVPIIAVLRVLSLWFFDVYMKGMREITLPELLQSVAVWAGYLVAALVTMSYLFEGFDLKAVAATSAVGSLVLGLALQPILSNFFSGLIIGVERPFRLNDWIRVGDHEGMVTAITWRTTHLRTRNNDNVIIPNSKIADENLLNYSLPHKIHMKRIYVGAHYNAPPYRVRRALLEAAAGVPGILEAPTPDVYTLSFDESSINYELRVWIEDYAQDPRIMSDVNARIWESFKKAGITIPFPIRTVELAPRKRAEKTASGKAPTAHLFVAEGPDRGHKLELTGAAIVIGRSRGCDFTLSDGQASKEHLRIEWHLGAYRLTDLGSSFGTRVNGEPVTERQLVDLDRITIGDSVIVFEIDA